MPDCWVAVVRIPGVDDQPAGETVYVVGFSERRDLERWLELCRPAVCRADAERRVTLQFGDIVLVPAIFTPRHRRDQ
jgi:hypothetical protein